MKYIYCIKIILIFFLVSSCDERITPKQEINPDLKLKTNFLTGTSWQYILVELVGENTAPKVIFSQDDNISLDSSYIDNYCAYYPDSTAEFWTQNDSEDVTWIFQNNQKQLKITDSAGSEWVYDIKKLTSDTVELSRVFKKNDFSNRTLWKEKLKELGLPNTISQYVINYTLE